jgi:hypothetical protein
LARRQAGRVIALPPGAELLPVQLHPTVDIRQAVADKDELTRLCSRPAGGVGFRRRNSAPLVLVQGRFPLNRDLNGPWLSFVDQAMAPTKAAADRPKATKSYPPSRAETICPLHRCNAISLSAAPAQA